IAADLQVSRRVRAEPKRFEGGALASEIRGFQKDYRLAGSDVGDAVQLHSAAEGARIVIHLPAGDVRRGVADVRHLEPIDAQAGIAIAARPWRHLGNDE